jgi:hypothetical protein
LQKSRPKRMQLFRESCSITNAQDRRVLTKWPDKHGHALCFPIAIIAQMTWMRILVHTISKIPQGPWSKSPVQRNKVFFFEWVRNVKKRWLHL